MLEMLVSGEQNPPTRILRQGFAGQFTHEMRELP